MNNYLDGVLVVEGKSDVCLLTNFIATPILKTNGFECSDDLLNFLKIISQKIKIYILADFDESGVKISEKLCKNLYNFQVLSFKSSVFTSKSKHGIAESNISELLDFLKPYFTNENWYKEIHDLVEYNNLSSKEKDRLNNSYFLNDATTKNIIKKWNIISSLNLE